MIEFMASIQQTPNGPVLVLKESALQEKGKDAQKNNIAAAKLVAELVKSSLGPPVSYTHLTLPTKRIV